MSLHKALANTYTLPTHNSKYFGEFCIIFFLLQGDLVGLLSSWLLAGVLSYSWLVPLVSGILLRKSASTLSFPLMYRILKL